LSCVFFLYYFYLPVSLDYSSDISSRPFPKWPKLCRLGHS